MTRSPRTDNHGCGPASVRERHEIMTAMHREPSARGDDPAHGLGPTRARVLSLLQDAEVALTAAAAGERLGLHVNSARFHLDGLAEDGLVVRRREDRTRPGRPKVLYAATDSAARPASRSYQLLAEILTTLVGEALPDPARSAEGAGNAWGRYLSPAVRPSRRPGESESLATLVQSLEGLGFDSQVVDDPNSLRLEISHCPFLEIAKTQNQVVCSVHHGMIRGILDQIDAPLIATELEPLVEPTRCIAHLQRAPSELDAQTSSRPSPAMVPPTAITGPEALATWEGEGGRLDRAIVRSADAAVPGT